MHLDRPALALVTAAVAIVVLVLLDRLRRRPVVLVVASLGLFPETAEVASAAARSRRREWRDLILRGLAAIALAVAAGGPGLARGARPERRVRIVLARGASLAAREPSGKTRLELAKDEVRRALERLAPEDRVDLVLLPPGPSDPEPGLAPSEAARALDPVRVVAAPGELESAAHALSAAASDLARDPAHALPALVVLDREPEPASVPEPLLEASRIALVGTPLSNRGIVGIGSSRDALDRERLLVAVENASDAPARVSVELRLARDVSSLEPAKPLVREVELGAGAIGSVIIDDASLDQARVVEARLVGEDALALDDRAIALRTTDAPVRIALAGDPGRGVETALRSCENVTVESFAPGENPLRGFDLSVVRAERDDEPAPHGACVFVCPPAAQAKALLEGRVTIGERAHSLLPSIDELHESFARTLASVTHVREKPPLNLGDLDVVARRESGEELIKASPESRGGSLVVYLGFDPASREADAWRHDASFPRFWAEIVERARERPEAPAALEAHPTGRSLVLPRPAAARASTPLEVHEPTTPPRVHRARLGRFVPIEAGVHRVRAEGAPGEALFAAALLDPRTSDLRQARTRGFDPATLAQLEARVDASAPYPVSGLCALAGLVAAALAWFLSRDSA